MAKTPSGNISVDTSDCARVALEFRNMAVNYSAEMKAAVLEQAKHTAEDMAFLSPKFTGYLKNSIRMEPTKDGADIKMAYYGKFVETGVVLSPLAIGVPKFQRWGIAKNYSIWYLINKVGSTQAHPFIKPSLDMAMSELPEIIKRHRDLAVMKSRV